MTEATAGRNPANSDDDEASVLALDTVAVAEQGGRRVAVMDLLKIKAPTGAERLDATVTALKNIVTVGEVRNLSAVRLSGATPWPSVSRALVERLLLGVNRFNIQSRKSQAAGKPVTVPGSPRRKALITGVTGQDGSYLAEFLLEKGYEVQGIKRRASSLNTGRVDHLSLRSTRGARTESRSCTRTGSP